MPKEIKDIKEFLELSRAKGVTSAIIKKNGDQTKFKIKGSSDGSGSLYTLSLNDADKAKKLKNSLPPALKIIEIGSKKPSA